MKNITVMLILFTILFLSSCTQDLTEVQPSLKSEEKLSTNQYYEFELEVTYLQDGVSKVSKQTSVFKATSWKMEYSNTTEYNGVKYVRHYFSTQNTSSCNLNEFIRGILENRVLSVVEKSKKIASCK